MAIIVPQNLVRRNSAGSEFRSNGVLQYGLYETGGSLVTAKSVGLVEIKAFECDQAGGFTFDPVLLTNGTGVMVKGYTSSGGVATGTNSLDTAGTPTGTNSAPNFVGAALANHAHTLTVIESAAFPVVADVATIPSGFSVMECVFVTAGGVTGVFEVIPSVLAPATGEVSVDHVAFTLTFFAGDAVGAIMVSYLRPFADQNSGGVPAGAVSAPMFTGVPMVPHTHIFTGNPFGGGAAEIPNGTNLSSLGNIAFEATGL